ncbi:hypothetical protein OEZ86_005606 [Tetradesmus obliquus]|nr:hypothetical protein OEZ86_005606 [Tetradesmus obliquus]
MSTASVHRPAPALLAPRVLPQRHCPVHTRSSLADKIKHSLDFNKKGRLEVIDKLYRNPSKASLEAVLADDLRWGRRATPRSSQKQGAGMVHTSYMQVYNWVWVTGKKSVVVLWVLRGLWGCAGG